MEPHSHDPTDIRRRLEAGPDSSYLRDWVYGGIDGAVTTFALVAGVVGADLSMRTILVLGTANLLADGFSMAASNYLGTRTEHEERAHLEHHERRQIRHQPEGEVEEVRQILMRKGFHGEALDQAVEIFTRTEERWIDLMLAEEYGLTSNLRSPGWAAAATFSAFFVCGAIALLPYILRVPQPFLVASVLTGATFFLIGSLKSRWALKAWWLLGFETLAVGGAAAAVAFCVGLMFR